MDERVCISLGHAHRRADKGHVLCADLDQALKLAEQAAR